MNTYVEKLSAAVDKCSPQDQSFDWLAALNNLSRECTLETVSGVLQYVRHLEQENKELKVKNG